MDKTIQPFKCHRKTFLQQLKCKKALADLYNMQSSQTKQSLFSKQQNKKRKVVKITKNQLRLRVNNENTQMINKIQQLNLISNSLKLQKQKQAQFINTNNYWRKLDPKICNINKKFQIRKSHQQYNLPYKKIFYQSPELIQKFVTGGYQDNQYGQPCKAPVGKFKKIKQKFYTLQCLYQSVKKSEDFKKLNDIRYSQDCLGNLIHNIQLQNVSKVVTARQNQSYKIKEVEEQNQQNIKKKVRKYNKKKRHDQYKNQEKVMKYLQNIRQRLLK